MPIEPATTITGTNGFVVTNPTDNDALQQGAQQIRLVKSVLTTTFPNVTAPITATAAQINAAAGATVLNVTTVPAGTTAHDGGHLTLAPQGSDTAVTLRNAIGALAIDVGTTPAAVAIDTAGNITTVAAVNAASIWQQGAVLIPRGMVMLWAGSVGTIPAGWALCDGSNSTPDLRGSFILGAGGSFSPSQTGGQFSYTASTDTQGAHAHSGNTALANGGVTLTGTTDTQGAHSHGGGTSSHTLTIAEIPSHSHTLEYGSGSGGSTLLVTPNFGTGLGPGVGADNTGGGGGHGHVISTDGAHSHNVSVGPTVAHQHAIATDGAHAHNVVVNSTPPYYALAFVMKL